MVSALSGLLLTNPSSAKIYIPLNPQTTYLNETLPGLKSFVYIVDENDSITSIAFKLYGNAEYWTTLWNDNPWIQDPANVEPGQKLAVRLATPQAKEELLSDLAYRYSGDIDISSQSPVYSYSVIEGPTIQPTQAVVSFATPTPSGVANYIDVYKQAGAAYGVPWQILAGVHSVESGARDGAIGSGHGPEGPMQFVPGTFNAYQVPGHPNIDNATDAIYAAANYIAKHGDIDHALIAYGTNRSGAYAVARSLGYTN